MDRRHFLAAGAGAPLAALPAPARAVGQKVLRVALPTAETSFDPAVVQDLYSNTINLHIFDPPLAFDPMARPVRLIPNTTVDLPEVSTDFRTYTLRLKPGILFHDDPAFRGRPRELIAADYAYSIKRVFDPRWKSQVLFQLEPARIVGIDKLRQRALKDKRPFEYDVEIEGLRVLDRYTLRIRLEEPNPRFVQSLSDSSVGAVAREVVEAYGDEVGLHPIGTGPFRLASWTRSARIVLERNATFREMTYDFEPAADAPELAAEVARLRGRRVPFVDRVEISVLEEDQPRWLTFIQGKLDHLELPWPFVPIAVPGGQIAPHLARHGVRARATQESSANIISFNIDDPVLGGITPERVALRRAISLAFDTREYIRSIYKGAGIVAQSPLVPGTFGFDGQPVTDLSTYSPTQAKALLDTYGYVDVNNDGWRERPDGAPLTLRMASTTTQRDREQNDQWRRFMKAVGLKIEFEIAQWPELVKRSLAGKLMIWQFGWTAGRPDSDLFFSIAYGPNLGSSNDARFDLAAYNRLYEEQRRLPDGEERRRVFLEATKLLVAYMPYKYAMHRIRYDLTQPWLLGYRRHPFTQRQWLWLDIDPAATGAAAA